MEIIFLGTSSMYPTKTRSHPAVLLKYNGHNLLFDCGEGTQRQMRIANESVMKIEAIFITHWHGDHSLGLGGIIQSMSASKRENPLVIIGPKGTANSVKCIINTYKFKPTFEIRIVESEGGVVYSGGKFHVEAIKVKHSVPTLAYKFVEEDRRKINMEYVKKFGLERHPILGKLQKGETIEWNGNKITPEEGTILIKGKRVSYVVDTKFFNELIDFVKNSDLLISEATFSDELKDVAEEYFHMTASQVGTLAKRGSVKLLYLTHLSQRYEKDPEKILNEAKKVFESTHLAEDLLRIELN